MIVDAAAERLTIPNVYLGGGADMVAYSGGKCLRGPQCAGLLLGRKDLLQAAWANSAPHHAFGRALKVAKEEIMGLLTAVETWTTRDHDAEWKQWEGWLATIRESVTSIPTVRTEVLQPQGAVQLCAAVEGELGHRKGWHYRARAGRPSAERNPRIVDSGRGGNTFQHPMPYMMMPGEGPISWSRRKFSRVVVESAARRPKPAPSGSTAQVGGEWDVEIVYTRDRAAHTLFLEQNGAKLRGSHRGEFLTADASGSVDGSKVRCHSLHHYEGTSIGYKFEGVADGDTIRGTVDVGEYGKVPFTARRHFHA